MSDAHPPVGRDAARLYGTLAFRPRCGSMYGDFTFRPRCGSMYGEDRSAAMRFDCTVLSPPGLAGAARSRWERSLSDWSSGALLVL